MPGWLVAALALLGGGAALADPQGGLLPLPSIFGGGDRPTRRRRRRALTASDRADIGFITGLLGPSAGKLFAIQIVTR